MFFLAINVLSYQKYKYIKFGTKKMNSIRSKMPYIVSDATCKLKGIQ